MQDAPNRLKVPQGSQSSGKTSRISELTGLESVKVHTGMATPTLFEAYRALITAACDLSILLMNGVPDGAALHCKVDLLRFGLDSIMVECAVRGPPIPAPSPEMTRANPSPENQWVASLELMLALGMTSTAFTISARGHQLHDGLDFEGFVLGRCSAATRERFAKWKTQGAPATPFLVSTAQPISTESFSNTAERCATVVVVVRVSNLFSLLPARRRHVESRRGTCQKQIQNLQRYLYFRCFHTTVAAAGAPQSSQIRPKTLSERYEAWHNGFCITQVPTFSPLVNLARETALVGALDDQVRQYCGGDSATVFRTVASPSSPSEQCIWVSVTLGTNDRDGFPTAATPVSVNHREGNVKASEQGASSPVETLFSIRPVGWVAADPVGSGLLSVAGPHASVSPSGVSFSSRWCTAVLTDDRVEALKSLRVSFVHVHLVPASDPEAPFTPHSPPMYWMRRGEADNGRLQRGRDLFPPDATVEFDGELCAVLGRAVGTLVDEWVASQRRSVQASGSTRLFAGRLPRKRHRHTEARVLGTADPPNTGPSTSRCTLAWEPRTGRFSLVRDTLSTCDDEAPSDQLIPSSRRQVFVLELHRRD